jgi:hypothetical protein
MLDFEQQRQHNKTDSSPSCSKAKNSALEPEEPSRTLRRECLNLCISLLDHSLKGNIYDSVVVGFFAVLGINKERKGHPGTRTVRTIVEYVALIRR